VTHSTSLFSTFSKKDSEMNLGSAYYRALLGAYSLIALFAVTALLFSWSEVLAVIAIFSAVCASLCARIVDLETRDEDFLE